MFILYMYSCSVQKRSTSPEIIDPYIKVAKLELQDLLHELPEGSEINFGFNNRSEFNSAILGEPFSLYRLENDKLVKSSIITIPLIVNEKFISLLRIDSIENELHIVDFGASELASEIQSETQKYSNLSFNGILRLYSLYIDFIIMSSENVYYYVPLSSARAFMRDSGFRNYGLLTFNELIKIVAK